MSTCTCNICSGAIEFESSKAGQTIQCPHCGIETILFIPGKALPNSTSRHTDHSAGFQTCPTCGNKISVTANSCPKCGHTFKYAGAVNLKDPVHIIGLGICVVIVVLVIIYILSQV
jgi:DNA-directed RNA polymerase subunit RPC12/RpoP